MKCWTSQQQPIGSSSNFKPKLMGPNHSQKGSNEDNLQWEKTSNGRLQNMKSWIYQQSLIRSSSNFKPKLMGPNPSQKGSNEDNLKWKTTSNGIRHQMEDDLKWKTTSITKSRISQQLLVPYFLNFKLKLISPKQTFQIFQKTISNGRGPQMEDYLKY